MTVTTETTDAPNVAGALETRTQVLSELHPAGSFEVSDHAAPSGKEESWRFTPFRRLRGLQADAPLDRSTLDYSWTSHEDVQVTIIGGGADHRDQLRSLRGVSGFVPSDLVTARVLTEVPSTLLVDVAAGAQVADPIVVSLTGTDAAVTEGAHLVLQFGENSRADVVLSHEGSASVAQVVEVVAGDGATVSVTTVQDWADDAVHLGFHHVRVGRDARVKHTALTFGGDLVRLSTSCEYAGPGGEIELLGLYYADAGQHLEHRIFVDHAEPNCTSNALFKGALQGKSARTVWVGDVLIRKSAEGTQTYEMNRNLLLTPGARADSVPNLEIETGEIVGAGHASATGRFDDEQLFYLMSRGIAPDVARRLVVRGFFGEVLLRLGVPSVVERATATIERELAITGY